MKRSRASKSKSSPGGQGKATPSPSKSATAAARPRKGRPAKKGPDNMSNNSADDTVADRPAENATGGATGAPAAQDEERVTSPDPNCSICLCKMEDKSFTHSCFHMFCFTCLLEWSKIKAECPLCKQSFTSIIHNIRSESDYDVYQLRDAVPASPPTVNPDDDIQLFPFLFGRSSLRPWTSLLTPIDLQMLADLRSTAQGFYSDDPFHIFQHAEGRNRIYREERWAREIDLPPGITYRNISPEYFSASAGTEYWQRITTWIDRELATLSRHGVAMRSHVRDYVMHLLQRYDVRSENFHTEVEPFFGSQTRLFLNQLHNFVRSPLSIRETDHQTVYSDRPPSPPENEVITLDRDDSDIEIVSPTLTDAAHQSRRNHDSDWPIPDPVFSLPSRTLEVDAANDHDLRVNSPIAGPSGMLLRPQQTIPSDHDFPWTLDSSVTDLHEVSDSESESSSTSHCDNEIEVVGFDKPWRARSPISLSSDGSDVEVDEGGTDTNPGSGNKSPESVVRVQSGSQTAPTPDVEGDPNSKPWSEFSPYALSEISSGGSFDRSLDLFLRSNSPFLGFERRFPSKKVFNVDCDICEECKDDVVMNASTKNPEELTAEDPVFQRRQSRKRNRDDCGDSGVVVDVEQFGDTDEPPPKKYSTYKKHYRGHKRSTNRPEASDGTTPLGDDPEILEPPRQTDTSTGGSSCTHESPSSSSSSSSAGSSIALSHQVSEGSTSPVASPKSNDKSPCSRCADVENDAVQRDDLSSISTCCNNSTDSDAKSSSVGDSSKRSGESAAMEKNPTLDAGDESTTCCCSTKSESSDTSRICDNLDVSPHSVESIDSDDSVQWLDSERPAVEQRNRHISIGSNESFLSSPSVDSVVLQLSDDDDEDECHSVDASLSSDLDEITPSRPRSLVNLEGADDSSSPNSAAIRTSVNGVEHLAEFLAEISDDSESTVSDDGVVSLLQLTGSETDNQVNRDENFPATSQSALECDLGDNDILKCENVSDKVPHIEKPVNGVEHNTESSETEWELGDNDILKNGNVSNKVRCSEKPVNGVKCNFESSETECVDDDDDILKSGNVANPPHCVDDKQVDSVKCNLDSSYSERELGNDDILQFEPPHIIEKQVNGVECDLDSSERERELGKDDMLQSRNVADPPHCDEKQVNGVECDLESSESERELGDDDILTSGNISDVPNCNEKHVNSVKCHVDSSYSECELGDNDVLKSGEFSDVPYCNGTLVNGIKCSVDDVDIPAVHSPPTDSCTDDRTSELSETIEAAISNNGIEK